MSKTAERLKSELSQLSPKDRAELAHFLLHSLDEANPATEAAWDAELAERIQEIRNGQAIGEPAEKVFAELREKYS
jgi:putative addiction module component (TIGR02574 family)